MHHNRPGAQPFTQRSPRVVAARRLLRRRHRDAEQLFLAEGPPAVREALHRPEQVQELFVTVAAHGRYDELTALAQAARVPVWPVSESGLASLTDTVTPQGVVAVCRHRHITDLDAVVAAASPTLVVLLAGVADPGNAGTVLRTADAVGAELVIFPDGSVDPYNGKCVRASAGSLFHVTVVRGGSVSSAIETMHRAGLTVLAADAHADTDLDDLADQGMLGGPTAWVFGSEAHGLAPDVAAATDARVKIPIYGAAESLNLAAAGAVCLYASARAHRPPRSSPA